VTRTAAGALVGTPQYIAPEQARGQRVDARSDIYAFGGILFEHVGIHEIGPVRMAKAFDDGRRRAVLKRDRQHLAQRRRIVQATQRRSQLLV